MPVCYSKAMGRGSKKSVSTLPLEALPPPQPIKVARLYESWENGFGVSPAGITVERNFRGVSRIRAKDTLTLTCVLPPVGSSGFMISAGDATREGETLYIPLKLERRPNVIVMHAFFTPIAKLTFESSQVKGIKHVVVAWEHDTASGTLDTKI